MESNEVKQTETITVYPSSFENMASFPLFIEGTEIVGSVIVRDGVLSLFRECAGDMICVLYGTDDPREYDVHEIVQYHNGTDDDVIEIRTIEGTRFRIVMAVDHDVGVVCEVDE